MQKSAVRVAYISAFSLVNSGLNFLYQIVIANLYGAGLTTDLFFLAFSFPEWIINITVMILPVSIIPAFTKTREESGQDAAVHLANTFMTYGTLTLGVLVGAIVVMARPLAGMSLSHGAASEITEVARHLRIMIPAVLTTSVSWLLNGLSYVRDKYLIPAIAPVLQTGVMIGILVTLHQALGIHAASIGFLAGSISQFLLLVLTTPRELLRLRFRLRGSGLSSVLALLLPLLLGNIVLKSEVFVTRYLASLLAAGSVSYIFYGGRLVRVLARFASRGIATVTFPLQAKQHATGDDVAFGKLFGKTTKVILLLCALVGTGLWAVGEDLIQLLFVRGEFSARDAQLTYMSAIAMVGVLMAYPLGDVINNASFAIHDTRSVVRINLIWFVPILLLRFGLQSWLGLIGLALAGSIGAVLVTGTLMIVLARKQKSVSLRGAGTGLAKALAGSALTVLVVLGTRIVLPSMPPVASIVVYGSITVLVYLVTVSGMDKDLAALLKRSIRPGGRETRS